MRCLSVDSKHDQEQECVSSQGEKNFKTTEGLLGRLSSLVWWKSISAPSQIRADKMCKKSEAFASQ